MQFLKKLYPEFLRRTDFNLLTSQPLVWRTRVHEFVWFSLVLGNLLALIAGVFFANTFYAITERNLNFYAFLAVIPIGFILLFWAIRLSRFKPKFDDIRSISQTWLIYVACIMMLFLNVAVFISTIGFTTAAKCPHSLTVLENDHKYVVNLTDYQYVSDKFDDAYNLLGSFYTPKLNKTLSRYPHKIPKESKVNRMDLLSLKNHLNAIMDAKKFAQAPVSLQSINNTAYHSSLIIGGALMFAALLFFPVIFYIIERFGFLYVLIGFVLSAVLSSLLSIVTFIFGFASGLGMGLFWNLIALILLSSLVYIRSSKEPRITNFWKYGVSGLLMWVPGAIYSGIISLTFSLDSSLYTSLIVATLIIIPTLIFLMFTIGDRRTAPTY